MLVLVVLWLIIVVCSGVAFMEFAVMVLIRNVVLTVMVGGEILVVGVWL